MKKLLLNLLALTCFTTTAVAQDFPYGTFTQAELNATKYAKDTSAHAYVINEFGATRINADNEGQSKVYYEYHVKIKILDDKSFDKGTVTVLFKPVVSADREELVNEIEGITTYLDDNGNAKTAKFDAEKTFVTKENKYWNTLKFTMPNMRKGCIIEYKYKLISPYWSRFPNWEFQSDIPKEHSEYEVHIPGLWVYNVSIRGELKLTKNTSEIERECYINGPGKADCSLIRYGMDNIPALTEEDYMTSPKNFLSAIYFQLSDWTDPQTGVKHKYTKEWKDIDYQFKHDDEFGVQLRKKDPLKQYVLPVIAGKTDELEKAKAVYELIQKNIKWNNIRSITTDGIKKAFESHSGHIGDINLSLVSALTTAGIHTDAVLLSTRRNGLINRLYPVDDDFDYVIAKAVIGDKTYLLDATDPLLPFGMLPIKCLNDQGRVMSLDKPSEWIDLVAAQKETSTSTLDLTMQNNGKLKGTIITYSNGYGAYNKRSAIKKFNTTDEYVEDMDEKLTKLKILKSEITNLDSLDMPLAEKYEVEIDLYDNLNSNRMAFNPVIMDRILTNKFKLHDRTYPVDMGSALNNRYILTLHLPPNYLVESTPQPLSIALPNKGGLFINEYSALEDVLTYSNVLQLNHSVYMPEEYPYLKEFYNKIIASEKGEIVIKKK